MKDIRVEALEKVLYCMGRTMRGCGGGFWGWTLRGWEMLGFGTEIWEGWMSGYFWCLYW